MQAHEQVVDRRASFRAGQFGKLARLECGFQGDSQPQIFRFVNREIGFGERRLLRSGVFARDQFWQIRQARRFTERQQIHLRLARSHAVDAREEDAEHVEERFYPAQGFLGKKAPFRLGESQVMVRMMARRRCGERVFGRLLFCDGWNLRALNQAGYQLEGKMLWRDFRDKAL